MRKFLPLLNQAEDKGIKVYKLNIGNPDFLPPKDFCQKIKKHLGKRLPYAPSPGIPEHIDAWRKYYQRWQVKLNQNQIVITTGCAEAIILALLAITDPGDEVIVFEPLYVSYKSIATALNIKLRVITLDIKNNFLLPSDKIIANQINKKTKAILIINPNNPTGSIVPIIKQKRLIELAQKKNLFILADETYREIVFKDQPSSFISYPLGKDSVIIVDSLSKRFSCPGARIGCVVSQNQEVMSAVLKLAMMRLSAPTLEQYALIPCLKNPKSYIQKITNEYKKRCNLAYKTLQGIPGVKASKPDGAFYLMADLPVTDSEKFVKFMLTDFNYQNQTVLMTPAKDFYLSKNLGANQIRIALVLASDDLKKALFIFKKGLQDYLAKVKK